MFKKSEYGSGITDDRGETPLLAGSQDNYETTYNTTDDRDGYVYEGSTDEYSASETKREDSDSDKDELTEVSESESSKNVDDDVDEFEQLVREAQGMEKQVREKMTTMPPWMLRICVVIFTLLAVVALVGGILYIFSIVSAYQTIIQWTTVTIAILGNCFGSCAVYYSGSFKSEMKSLAKGVKRLQATSEQLAEYIQEMKRNRDVLRRTTDTLKQENEKLEMDVQNFEENEKIINDTGVKIEKNAMELNREAVKLDRMGKLFAIEEKRFSKTVLTMAGNQKKLETFNRNAKGRVENLTTVVESLKDTIPELDEQLKRFNNLRKQVEEVSKEMGGDVDNTKTTVTAIFNEITELHIRQERIMLYQLLERVLSKTQNWDEMDIGAFRRFITQIPDVYGDMEELHDSWFHRYAHNGVIGRSELKHMIDKITLNKVQNKE